MRGGITKRRRQDHQRAPVRVAVSPSNGTRLRLAFKQFQKRLVLGMVGEPVQRDRKSAVGKALDSVALLRLGS
jgi:hypothetical protein